MNRPKRFTNSCATIIDQVLANSMIDSPLHKDIVKTDIIDHFAVFWLLKTNFEQSNIKNTIREWDINQTSDDHFNFVFNSIDWGLVTKIWQSNNSFNTFKKMFKFLIQRFLKKKLK